MSKISKLVANPSAFFKDSKVNKSVRNLLRLKQPQTTPSSPGLPSWVNPNFEADFRKSFVEGQFIYVPWIKNHGDRLIQQLDPDGEKICPLRLFAEQRQMRSRPQITKYARKRPDMLHKIVLRVLAPRADAIAGLILTLDWTPLMRSIAYTCRALEIPVVLVPHEGVFADESLYYRDIFTNVDFSIADQCLLWGDLQARIFAERGIAAQRLEVVGAAKFDPYFNFKPSLSRKRFCLLHSLRAERPILLYAMQPLDSQFDEVVAKDAQLRALDDVLSFALKRDLQVIVRCPPAGKGGLSNELIHRIEESSSFSLDGLEIHMTDPEEAIFHSAGVLSINSTMLFEARLLGRPSLATRYIDFECFWSRAGIPSVHNDHELEKELEQILATGGTTATESGIAWASCALSNGSFDGGAVGRIRKRLEELKTTGRSIRRQDVELYSHLFTDGIESPSFGIAGYHRDLDEKTKYLPTMLGFRYTIFAGTIGDAAACDVMVKWGISPTGRKDRNDRWSRVLGRPQIIVEDGFVRSVDIGLSGTPTLSIIVDDKTAYYDATQISRLETRLNNPTLSISKEQEDRSRNCISLIQEHRVSKYNHAPDLKSSFGDHEHKVLVVDQRFGDASVEKGLANEETFSEMLLDALSLFPNSDVIIKRHPDATKGGKESYYSDSNLKDVAANLRVHVIDFEVNPHALFDVVQDVFVVTSGMGMEALLAGKSVHCYGAPYYSNWGVTIDKKVLARRSRQRTVVEIFHFAYIESSRYYSPTTQVSGTLEDVIAYVAEEVEKKTRSGSMGGDVHGE